MPTGEQMGRKRLLANSRRAGIMIPRLTRFPAASERRRHILACLFLLTTAAASCRSIHEAAAPVTPTDALQCAGVSPCQFYFSFEDGFEGWLGRAADAGPWRIERTSSRARDGQWALNLHAQNTTDATKLWIERAVAVRRSTPYAVRLEYAICCISYELSFPNLFNLIADVRHAPPPGSGSSFDFHAPNANEDSSAAIGATTLRWRHKRFDLTARSDSAGRLYVSAGVLLRFEVDFTFQLDNVRVTFIEQTP